VFLESNAEQQATHKRSNESTATKNLCRREASDCQAYNRKLYPCVRNPLAAMTEAKFSVSDLINLLN
jgi:hypothetical protein